MIIGLIGYAKSGKDTVANLICAHNDIKRVAFADALKRDICDLLEISMDELNEQKEMIRPLLVEYGRMRRMQNRDYWIGRVVKSMYREVYMGISLATPDNPDYVIPYDVIEDKIKAMNWIITDVRYENEVAWILAQGGKCIRLVREAVGPANLEEAGSIAAIMNGRPEIVTVVNQEGKPGACADEVWKLIS